MRIVLATGLFAIGVELPQSYMAQHAKGLLVMVVPTMAFGWVIVAGTSVSISDHHRISHKRVLSLSDRFYARAIPPS
jgi:hypothetical protein